MTPSALTAVPTSEPTSVNWRGIGCFVVIAYALMWLVCLPLWVTRTSLATLPAQGVMVVGMSTPALASFLVCRLVDHTPWLRRVGVVPPTSVRPLVALSLTAFTVVTACFVAATALGALLGLVHLDLVGLSGITQLESELPRTGRPLPSPLTLLLVSVVGTVIASFSANALAAAGEEIGWRGYLLPALLPLGRVRALVVVGVVWAFWHAPIILLGYDYEDAGRAMALVALSGFCILFGTFLAWLRVRSDSVVPAAVAHGTVNGWMRVFPVLVAAGQPVSSLVASPMGLVGYAVFGALAAWVVTRCPWVPRAARGAQTVVPPQPAMR